MSEDAKKGGGYLKEKLIIGLTRFTSDEVERAILKVTSHMLKAPNAKHMERLITATFGQYNSGTVDHGDVNRYILEEIEKRTHTHNWIIVLKSFVALHHLMNKGSPAMTRCMGQRLGLFSARNIKDIADTPEGAAQKVFIEQYIQFLEERAISQLKLIDCGLPPRIDSDELYVQLNTVPLEDLPIPFDLMLRVLELLAKIEFRATIVDNFLTLEAYRLAVCDGKALYRTLMNRVLSMLEAFEDQPLALRNKLLKLYMRFDTGIKLLARMFDQMNAANIHWGELIPSLKLLPESIVKRLEDDIKYSDVKSEDLSSVLGTASVVEDRGPRVRSQSPPQEEPTPAPVKPAKEEPELPPPAPLPLTATAPRAEALDDLFTPTISKTHTGRAEPSTTTTKVVPNDFWGAPPAPAPGTTATISPRTSVAQPRENDFDPFATPAPAPAAPAPTSANGVDFFFNNSTPQQQTASRSSQPPPPGAGAVPFSELASQQRQRAW